METDVFGWHTWQVKTWVKLELSLLLIKHPRAHNSTDSAPNTTILGITAICYNLSNTVEVIYIINIVTPTKQPRNSIPAATPHLQPFWLHPEWNPILYFVNFSFSNQQDTHSHTHMSMRTHKHTRENRDRQTDRELMGWKISLFMSVLCLSVFITGWLVGWVGLCQKACGINYFHCFWNSQWNFEAMININGRHLVWFSFKTAW